MLHGGGGSQHATYINTEHFFAKKEGERGLSVGQHIMNSASFSQCNICGTFFFLMFMKQLCVCVCVWGGGGGGRVQFLLHACLKSSF